MDKETKKILASNRASKSFDRTGGTKRFDFPLCLALGKPFYADEFMRCFTRGYRAAREHEAGMKEVYGD